MTPHQYGEHKHETCRYGALSPAFCVEVQTGAETPTLMPLCHWKAAEHTPPASVRCWGGAVEYDRDCAVCMAHKPVELESA